MRWCVVRRQSKNPVTILEGLNGLNENVNKYMCLTVHIVPTGVGICNRKSEVVNSRLG